MTTPKYLLKERFLYSTVAFVVVFSFLYLCLYRPYSDTFWLSLTTKKYVVPTILFYAISIFILFISKYVLIRIQSIKESLGLAYITTCVVESVLISLVYVVFSHFVLVPGIRITFSLCMSAIFCVSAILCIPYTICALYAGYKEKEQELLAMQMLTNSSEISILYKELKHEFIDFRDSNGNLKLTLDASTIYYIESQDNYVNICYLVDDKLESYLLRCRTKDIEELIKDTPLLRCHRSYIVNPDHIKHFSTGNGGRGNLEMDFAKSKDIPVSKTYMPEIQQVIAARA